MAPAGNCQVLLNVVHRDDRMREILMPKQHTNNDAERECDKQLREHTRAAAGRPKDPPPSEVNSLIGHYVFMITDWGKKVKDTAAFNFKHFLLTSAANRSEATIPATFWGPTVASPQAKLMRPLATVHLYPTAIRASSTT
ncbi:hypothetical protein KIN20_014497 [Parelaphostrongylus tenuis]|uniref:Uncharacterized protein n=1 Tax=Parelaphostrongylus tenuis TaxID=148309 RepID=A0AAD5N3C4_PARTN|nr:hypothetical protein KIN20_014497 [Parelaphostrongylus tenuis]